MAHVSSYPLGNAGLSRLSSILSSSTLLYPFFVPKGKWCMIWAFALMGGLSFSGCAETKKTTNTVRSTWEQLLLSQSLQRTLSSATIPLDPGESVSVESVGLTDDKGFAKEIVEQWLRQKGLHVGTEAPKYLIRVILHSFGTEQSDSFLGIPEIQSTIIPFALPELSIFKSVKQRGHSRINLEVSDKKSGGLISSSPLYEATVYFNQYVFLLAFGYNSTDIVPPPL